MQGFFKQEMNNIKQILFCTDPQVSVGIIVDDSGVDAGDDGRKIVPAGTPMYGSLLNRATPFTITGSDTTATLNETLTTVEHDQVAVDMNTFPTKVRDVADTYVFTWELLSADDGVWNVRAVNNSSYHDSVTFDNLPIEYGVDYYSGPMNGDTIAIDFTPAAKPTGVLLHDVDVTAGDENGTLLIFGFVNINRLDEATAAAIQAAASDLDGKVFVCAG